MQANEQIVNFSFLEATMWSWNTQKVNEDAVNQFGLVV